MKEWQRRGFNSPEEYYTYVNLTSHMNGWHGAKRREPGRIQMAKRRRQGLTQKAAREYSRRNTEAIKMYQVLMKLEPKLVRKGKHSFGRGVK